MNRVFEPGESLSDLPWPPVFRFGWPRNFRTFMFYSFAAASIGFLVPALYGLSHYHDMPLLRILLMSPIFDFCVVALSGIAVDDLEASSLGESMGDRCQCAVPLHFHKTASNSHA